MADYAIPIVEKELESLLDAISKMDVEVAPYKTVVGESYLIKQDKAKVILTMMKPEHWAIANDIRKDLAVVTIFKEAIFAFWRDKKLINKLKPIIEDFKIDIDEIKNKQHNNAFQKQKSRKKISLSGK